MDCRLSKKWLSRCIKRFYFSPVLHWDWEIISLYPKRYCVHFVNMKYKNKRNIAYDRTFHSLKESLKYIEEENDKMQKEINENADAKD